MSWGLESFAKVGLRESRRRKGRLGEVEHKRARHPGHGDGRSISCGGEEPISTSKGSVQNGPGLGTGLRLAGDR